MSFYTLYIITRGSSREIEGFFMTYFLFFITLIGIFFISVLVENVIIPNIHIVKCLIGVPIFFGLLSCITLLFCKIFIKV